MKKSVLAAITILILVIINSELYCQEFQNEVLIDIPGDNYDFDVISGDIFCGDNASLMTWINRKDSNYTVYLKQISPVISENIILLSDETIKSHPKITFGKVTWQNFYKNYYQIVLCQYSNLSPSEIKIIIDSLETNPQITLSSLRIAWIERGNLLVKELDNLESDPILIDSLNCNSPDILDEDSKYYSKVLYLRGENECKALYLAEYSYYSIPKWKTEMVSVGTNQNPRFGMLGGISFDVFDSNCWKIKYTFNGDFNYFDVTRNKYCNYRNSFLFSYGVITKSSQSYTPFFVIFENDSIKNNKEIFIITDYFGTMQGVLNISNLEGNDASPQAAYFYSNDTMYISIIWVHEQNSRKNIWVAKSIFNPNIGAMPEHGTVAQSFNLFQNYPNPFNQTTIIRYRLSVAGPVSLKIFNLQGRLIRVLVNENLPAGNYLTRWDGRDNNGLALPSGIYFCSMEADGQFRASQKMILMK